MGFSSIVPTLCSYLLVDKPEANSHHKEWLCNNTDTKVLFFLYCLSKDAESGELALHKKNFGSSDQMRVSKSNDLSNLGTSTWHPLKKSLQWWNAKSNSLRWCVVWTVLCNMIWISKSSRLNFSGGPKYGFSTPINWNQFRSCEALPEICQCIGRGLMITPKNVCVPWALPLCTEDISILWGLPLLWQTLLEHILTVCKAQSDSQALWIFLWTGCYPTFLSIGKKSFGLQAQHFYLVKNPSICEHKFLPDHPSWLQRPQKFRLFRTTCM